MARVALEAVTKRFGEVVAVNRVTLEVADREFLVLVGPSGCGKTTCLRLIAGLEELTSGNIYIGDRLVNDVEPKDRDIAMVFQNYALYPHMNVYDNMSFALRLRRYPPDEIDRRVKNAAELLGIGDLLRRKPRELSGGQRQRVALGRAIVRDPQVFLMDEPLSNLDAKLRVQTRTELSKLQRRLEATVIYVTHDQTEAMTMGDRIVVMKDGVVQQIATPNELYDRPANVFVAGFIGSPAMNFLPCRVVVDGATYLANEDFRLEVPAGRAAPVRALAGRPLLMGIRPEDIHDDPEWIRRHAGAAADALVDVVEPLGAEAFLYLSLGEHHLTARVDPRTAAKDGDRIRIGFDMGRVHLFDAETQERAA